MVVKGFAGFAGFANMVKLIVPSSIYLYVPIVSFLPCPLRLFALRPSDGRQQNFLHNGLPKTPLRLKISLPSLWYSSLLKREVARRHLHCLNVFFPHSLSLIVLFFSVGRVDLCQMVLLSTLERYKVIVKVFCQGFREMGEGAIAKYASLG